MSNPARSFAPCEQAYNGLNNRPIQQTLSTTQIKSYGKSLN